MKVFFYFWLLIQLIITWWALSSLTYDAEHCQLKGELDMSKWEAEFIWYIFPIPIIVWGLVPEFENKNCE